ncbi:cell surface glycoprotein MUC18 isoform X2 [Lissotriton helveticus]
MSRLALCSRLLLPLLLLGSGDGVTGKVLISVPDEVEVKEGGTARIDCSFNISEPSNYTYQHWFFEKNGRTKISYMGPDMGPDSTSILDTEYKDRITVLPNFTLVIREVTVQDERTFVCQIGAGVVGFAEGRTELRVFKAPEPPVIKPNTVGMLVTDEPDEKIADCSTRNGFPAPNITWYKGRTPLQQNEKIHITTVITTESSGLFTVSSALYAPVHKQDREAQFYCEVNFRMPGMDRMMESDRVNITVYYPTETVTLTMESPQEPVKEGDTVTMVCEGDGNPAPQYSFHRVWESKDGEDEEEDIEDVTGEYLVLENVKKEQSGRYRCRTFDLNNPETDIKADLEISVNYLEPVEISPESPVEVMLGQDIVVHCNAGGSLPREYEWKRKEKEKIEMPGPELSLSNMTYEMGGRYSCLVSIPEVPGLNSSADIDILVKGKPQVLMKQQEVQVYKNEMVNLTCEAFGHPVPVITWDTDGSVIHSQESDRVSSQLSVLATSELLESGVTCNASNSLGSSSQTLRLESRVVIATTPSPSPPPTIVTSPTVTYTELKKAESRGVLIVVIIVCILLLAILGAVLYFLYKKGKIACGRSGKQNITTPDDQKDDIVVEMKTDRLPEEAELLQGSNGEKRPSSDMGEKYIDLRN